MSTSNDSSIDNSVSDSDDSLSDFDTSEIPVEQIEHIRNLYLTNGHNLDNVIHKLFEILDLEDTPDKNQIKPLIEKLQEILEVAPKKSDVDIRQIIKEKNNKLTNIFDGISAQIKIETEDIINKMKKEIEDVPNQIKKETENMVARVEDVTDRDGN